MGFAVRGPGAGAAFTLWEARMSKRWVLAVLAAAVIAVAFALSCSSSKSSNPTSPGGGALELNSGNIGASGVFAHTFNTAGTYNYHCAIHSQMTGSVTVVASGAATSAAIGIANFAFNPTSVQIMVGGTVTWTNGAASATHTVTSN
jgi:plastocyanin